MAGSLRVFLFGTLLHAPLLTLVAGRAVPMVSATLAGWRVAGVEGDVYPVLVSEAGAKASGAVITVTQDELDRLVHYEDAFDYAAVSVTCRVAGQEVEALVFRPRGKGAAPFGDWSLDHWVRQAAARTMHSASDIMGYQGRFSGADLQFRRSQIEARAHSRVEAEAMARPQVGSDQHRDTVDQIAVGCDHAGYFVTETVTLTHPTFAGARSAPIVREVFLAAEAVIVLPYDPRRDRVLLVEQFRMGPWRRGAPYPWMLEPVAGRVDPGESPEQTARREAEEEAGLHLHRLERIGSGYPTPGYSTEYFHVFLGLCDLPDGAEGLHGEASENEDIRTHVLSWPQAEDLLSRGEADNMPLVLALTWLSREQSRLRALA